MKKLLPYSAISLQLSAIRVKKTIRYTLNSIRYQKGFTLIELMVVVSIIAVLSVIALALFSNAQKSARDGKRRAELKAILNAFEINKTSAGYQPLLASFFAGGTIPSTDPKGDPYCMGWKSTSPPYDNTPISAWSGAGCPGGYSAIALNSPSGSPLYLKICASMENPATGFCIVSTQ